MGKYAGSFIDVAAGANDCAINLASDGVALPELIEINLGCSDQPDDEMYVMQLWHSNASGAAGGTAVDAQLRRPGPASVCTVKQGAFSTDPAKSSPANTPIETFFVHRRVRFQKQWNFGEGPMPKSAAEDIGLGVYFKNAPSAADFDGTIVWFE